MRQNMRRMRCRMRLLVNFTYTMRRRRCVKNALVTAFGDNIHEPMRGVTLVRCSRIRRRVQQHAAATQARRLRIERRIRQIMARKHTECYASCHTGRPSRIQQHVRYRPIHSEHSRKTSTEGNGE